MTVVLAAVATCALLPLARWVDLVDHPGGRKVHESSTPLTGGPAIFLVLLIVLVWTLPGDRFVQALGIGGAILFVTGMLDDYRHLSPTLRFLIQVVACLAMILWADVRLVDFGRLIWDGTFALGIVAVPITIFAAMGVINSFNMIDGMDGLAGSIFLVAALGMSLFAGMAGETAILWLLLVSMAAVLGFLVLNARLPWNPRARAFLGDAGSLLLGFILAWCFISLGSDWGGSHGRAYMPMTAVWLIAVPLLDTSTQIWRRWRSGESAFAADQYHLHHAFLRAGFSIGRTWIAITSLAVALGLTGVILELAGVPDYASFYIFMVFAFAYYFYMRHSWLSQRFLGRDFIYHEFTVEEAY